MGRGGGGGSGIRNSVLPDSEKPSLLRVNRALQTFLASRLGFLLPFYFVCTGLLLKSQSSQLKSEKSR